MNTSKPLIMVVKHPEGVGNKSFLTVMGLPVTASDDIAEATNFFEAFNSAAGE